MATGCVYGKTVGPERGCVNENLLRLPEDLSPQHGRSGSTPESGYQLPMTPQTDIYRRQGWEKAKRN